jgi:hypothetical protein
MSSQTAHSSRPLKAGEQDKLGFGPIAEHLAKILINKDASDGFVVAIEGSWGSGKSSLVSFIEFELSKQTLSPEIIRFEPWLIGQRDLLLSSLFTQIAAAIENIEKPNWDKAVKAKQITSASAKKFLKYTKATSRLASVAELAELFGAPSIISKALRGIEKITESKGDTPSIEFLKDDVIRDLKTLERRIIVIIDDLDRLEPNEAAEIMRLIRAVGNFPNIVYVLCFDREALAKLLEHALSIDNGQAFLQKIVQVRYRIPAPEAFDLRRWLHEECTDRVLKSNIPITAEEQNRLALTCDIEGGLLKTPRDVMQVLDSLDMHWFPVQGIVDISDVLWIQIIKLKNERLYSWIENYIVEVSAISNGASVSDDEKTDMSNNLCKIINCVDKDTNRALQRLHEQLPGIPLVKNGAGLAAFDSSEFTGLSDFVQARRLGSPQHYRYYFNFMKPAGALDDAEIFNFIKAAANGDNLKQRLMALAELRPQGGSFAHLLMKRLLESKPNTIPIEAIIPIIIGLSLCIDKIAQIDGEGDFGNFWVLNTGTQLVKKLLPLLADADQQELIEKMYSQGEAAAWLLGLIRDDLYKRKDQQNSRAIFTDAQLSRAKSLIKPRLLSDLTTALLDGPRLVSSLYAWSQIEDKDMIREWVNERVITDDDFLHFIHNCRVWTAINGKVVHPLDPDSLKEFIDTSEVEHRISSIADTSLSMEDRVRATELLDALRLGKRHTRPPS